LYSSTQESPPSSINTKGFSLGSFETLDYDGQLARLTEAARAALPAYGLASAQLEPVIYVNNATFRVETYDGKRYALRIHRPGHKRLTWIQSELEWLGAIHQGTPLRTAIPIPTVDGPLLTQIQADGIDKPLTCSLFEWIDGHHVAWDQISPEQVRQAGFFLGQLHAFSIHFNPPPDFARPKLDWEGLFGEESPYNPGAGAAIFTAEQRDVFAQVDARVGQVMDALGQKRETFGLIHADFIAKNFIFQDKDLYAIDFDDCGWGYYLYDLAPLLNQTKGEAHYGDIYAAYWEGYTSVRPLPDSDQAYLETFIAARHLASCRWIAGNLHNPRIRERATDILIQRTAELRRFLDTGAITQRGEQF
jgi:Ser/Thr protein kinase RdoA (MazF antagonist)